MNDDYLWDGSGKPDADVERLESALRNTSTPLPTLRPLPARLVPTRRSFAGILIPLATAAAVVMLVGAAGWYSVGAGRAGYGVAASAGAPRIAGSAIAERGRLRPGDWLETDALSRATIEVGAIGRVEVDRNTRLKLVGARAGEHRLSLASGRIEATIWAPPRFFFVETPSAVAVDLGCAYTLDVDPDGAGLLRVQHGWVGFEYEGRESFIPQNAVCRTRPGVGPGTPYYENAAPPLIDALLAFDFGDPVSRRAALQVALAEARSQDALSLWHLLTRVDRAESARVFDRLAALVPPPAGVTRAGIARRDRRMLDQWWNALGLQSASWWRLWKAPWPRVR
jgi:hypothetical protein